jgi:hypothetical protein
MFREAPSPGPEFACPQVRLSSPRRTGTFLPRARFRVPDGWLAVGSVSIEHEPPNKELKLTKPCAIGASQLTVTPVFGRLRRIHDRLQA